MHVVKAGGREALMMTFLFVAVLAILGFLWFAARAVISARGVVTESSSDRSALSAEFVVGGTVFDRIDFVVREQIQRGRKIKMPTRRIPDSVMNAHMQEHRRARVLMKCLAMLIARADSLEVASDSLRAS
jgi:hypothetical protein